MRIDGGEADQPCEPLVGADADGEHGMRRDGIGDAAQIGDRIIEAAGLFHEREPTAQMGPLFADGGVNFECVAVSGLPEKEVPGNS